MVDQVLQSNDGFNRSSGLVAIALLTGGLVGGLVGGLALAPASIAATLSNSLTGQETIGKASLIAQEIVDGLPPPPNVGQSTLPILPQSQQSQQMQPQGGASAVAVPDQVGGDRQYLVMIDGDSPRLLKQVQRVASSASVQDYQGQRMIVAAFDNSDRAQRQVQMLASRGIGARLIPADQVAATPTDPTVPVQRSATPMAVAPDLPPADLMPNSATPTVQVPSQVPNQAPSQALRTAPNGAPREVNFGGQSPSDQFPSPPSFPAPANTTRSTSPSDSPGRDYYVVVPGKQNELEAISNQIIRLGDGFGIAQLVQQSDTRGTHVQVGPFSDRQAANRWNHYFRDFGIDARVTLGR
jgi:hypothetical protein